MRTPKPKPKTSDTLQVVTIVGNTHVSCDVTLSMTTPALNAIENRTRREAARMLGRRLNHTELTDAMGKMARISATNGDDGALVALATWLAVRGAHSSIKLEDLSAGGTLVVATNDPVGAGPSWRYRLSRNRLGVLSPTMDQMTVH